MKFSVSLSRLRFLYLFLSLNLPFDSNLGLSSISIFIIRPISMWIVSNLSEKSFSSKISYNARLLCSLFWYHCCHSPKCHLLSSSAFFNLSHIFYFYILISFLLQSNITFKMWNKYIRIFVKIQAEILLEFVYKVSSSGLVQWTRPWMLLANSLPVLFMHSYIVHESCRIFFMFD